MSCSRSAVTTTSDNLSGSASAAVGAVAAAAAPVVIAVAVAKEVTDIASQTKDLPRTSSPGFNRKPTRMRVPGEADRQLRDDDFNTVVATVARQLSAHPGR
jgi:hypothetical protein